MNKVFILIKIVVTLAVFAVQFLMVRFAQDLMLYVYAASSGVGLLCLVISALMKPRGDGGLAGLLKWTGGVLLVLPVLYVAVCAFTLYYMFGFPFLAVVVPLIVVCVMATGNGSVVLPVVALIPIMVLLSYYRNIPNAPVTVVSASAAVAVAAFFLRNVRIRVGTPFRAVVVSAYFVFFYGGYWYLSPMTSFSAAVGNDAVAKHIPPIEAQMLKSPFPRGYYAVSESCDGGSLFVSNLFHTPGMVTWRRGDPEAVAHGEIDGAAEQIVFDCVKENVLIGEYNTGRILVDDGTTPGGGFRALPAKVPKPCRISHHPGSRLYFINSDYATFPWYIMDEDGNILKKLVVGQAEEIVPLEDDSFLTVTNGKLNWMRLGSGGKLKKLRVAALPGIGMSFGPLYQHLALDEARRTLFVSDFDTGFLFRVDLNSMRVKKLGGYGRGIRHMACSPKHGLLAAGNYTTGTILLIRESDGAVVYRRNIGTRLRGVTVSRDEERAYAVSRAGVFELSLKAATAPNR